MDDTAITDMNRRYLEHDYPTDVISFASPCVISGGWQGEIFLNLQRAVEITKGRGASACSNELALYLAHAINHLADSRDDTPRARARMRQRELRWLKTACEQGLLSGIVQ